MEELTLRSSRLAVTVKHPGEVGGARFDRTGFVTEVVLDGKHTFCAYELPGIWDPTKGAGLCGEFSNHRALGYDEAKPGEWFPKFGVGLLRRESDKGYEFMKPYEVRPYEVDIDQEDESVLQFTVHPEECLGYAVRYRKRLKAEQDSLRVDYELFNAGSRPIETNEYAHNFVCFDGETVGPDYTLAFTGERSSSFKVLVGDIRAEEESVEWGSVPVKDFYGRLYPGGEGGAMPSGWTLVHRPSGVRMSEDCGFPVELIAVWGMAHNVSPEVFAPVRIAPGETLTWSRTYRFEGS
ncbi:hypothetical protein GZH47_17290 [Paenibacillus rhizovicinus]|uniref:Aldose 1-epimerase n=1 Tax=Paenibacillus rhizovicinus TaxID=2704463 RepID=A0A6C0P1G7_9BACL|nr:hypothetical protein [Paenibacillus rhizovicinus]QHW32390.1 hypothetical protein GZH47_17290 [Paenibacillus rhizovicinus]